jgi:hypothetical protein
MKSAWLPHTLLRTASLIAPCDRRAEWLEEWRSELWYIPRRASTLFCLGAFRDALWLRRNSPDAVKRTTYLASPAGCLAFLAALAAVSLAISAGLLDPLRLRTTNWHMTARDLPAGCLLMLVYTGVILPITRLVMGRAPADGGSAPWSSRLRQGLFLTLKIALVQPIMLCGFLALMLIGPVAPLASQVGIFGMWILTCRWLIADQRQRCPVCLRRLTNTVRIGTPSQTFLDWYGAEWMCSRGHGLLRVPEIATSYSGRRQWLRLDGSWSGLFPQATGWRR